MLEAHAYTRFHMTCPSCHEETELYKKPSWGQRKKCEQCGKEIWIKGVIGSG